MVISRQYVLVLWCSVLMSDARSQENTLIDDYGNAQLCDFGLARILDDEPSGLTTTKTASWSLRYAAPELIKNDVTSHTRETDMWAWGCLLLVVSCPEVPVLPLNHLAGLRLSRAFCPMTPRKTNTRFRMPSGLASHPSILGLLMSLDLFNPSSRGAGNKPQSHGERLPGAGASYLLEPHVSSLPFPR